MKKDQPHYLKGKKILVAASGSIAAVKTPLLVSRLVQLGAEVRCLLTPSAAKLVSPLSLSTLSRSPCFQDSDQWESNQAKPLHIFLAEWAELIVIAPLSAASLGKWINGISDNLLTSVLLASEVPILAAAAMNTGMWMNRRVQHNWETLKNEPNVITITPADGLLACDRLGDGRMADIDRIELAIESGFIYKEKNKLFKHDLDGFNFLITAGPTLEKIDIARQITNRSSGKMGIMIAQAAKLRGGEVNFIHGPIKLASGLLEGLNNFPIKTASEMGERISSLQISADFIVMAAAVADIQRKNKIKNIKIPKEALMQSIQNDFELTPDLLSEITKNKFSEQIVLGFAAVTGSNNEIKLAGEKKRSLKGVDLLLANPIDQEGQGFEKDFNSGFLIAPNGILKKIPQRSKLFIAHELLDSLIEHKSNAFVKI